VRLGAEVERIGRLEDGTWRVLAAGDAALDADHVVFAGPAYVPARALAALDPDLARELGEIRYVSTASVFLALRAEDVPIPLDAVGFIVPRSERREILASTWVSSKWAGRAPEGYALIRVFFGGARREAILAHDDKELVAIAEKEIAATMGFTPRPVFTHLFRYDHSSPQPTLGHLARVTRIRELASRWPGLHLIGSGFAIGIPDCVKLAEETAKAVVAASTRAAAE
jgi:oxygen-dependent protoporphyrinogen oxidase